MRLTPNCQQNEQKFILSRVGGTDGGAQAGEGAGHDAGYLLGKPAARKTRK